MLNRRQICEWLEYARVSPFGYERREYSTALQTFHLLRGWLEDFEGEPKDFMPAYTDGRPKTEAEQIIDEILDMF